MILTVSAILSVALLWALIIFMMTALPRMYGDVLLLFALVFSLFYGFRALLFVLGLDGPFPESLFWPAKDAQVLTKSALGLSLYLLLVIVAATATTTVPSLSWGPFFVSQRPSLTRLARVTVLLTGIATLVSAALLAKYGSVGTLINAAKFDKSLAGLYVLRIFPAVGAVVASTLVLETAPSVRRNSGLLVGGLAATLLNCLYVFMWGSRSLFVVVGALLVLGLGRKTLQFRPSSTMVWRLVLASLMVVAIAGGLRIARDTLTQGAVQDVYSQGSTWRQASLATNSIQFDATMLAFRDWPDVYPYRGGTDYVNGALGVIPRSVWPGKPAQVTPGAWFRQVYEPGKVNGWPMGAATLWYLNFGWAGLAFGGLLSGVVVGVIASAQRRAPPGGWNLAVALVLVVFVFGLGWDSETPIRMVIWLVPLWLIARYVGAAPSSSKRLQAAGAVEA